MFLGSQFDRAEFKKQGKPNYGLRTLPAGPEREYWWLSPYDSWLFKGSKNKDAAWELLKHMGAGDGHYANVAAVGMFPIDTRLSARFAEPEDKYLLAALEKAWPQPFMPEFGASEATFPSEVEKLFLGQITAKQLITWIDDTVAAQIAKIYKT
jgi:multiple sugar transport system substrate-binding protein